MTLTCIHAYIDTLKYLHITRMHTHMHTHTYIHIRTCINAYIHAYIRTYTHTYIQNNADDRDDVNIHIKKNVHA